MTIFHKKSKRKSQTESEILFLAKFNETLDWDTINRLSEDNADFKNFSETISDTNKTSKVSKEYDKVLKDEKYEEYIINKRRTKCI